MLSRFFLAFQDRETQAVYLNHKRSFYAKSLPIVLITQILLTVGLFLVGVKTAASSNTLEPEVIRVSCAFVAALAAMTLLVRWSHIACWFVSPLLTSINFYYFAFVDYEPSNVATVFTVVGAVSVSYLISIMFSEVWLISTIVYVPLITGYMAILGDDYIAESTDNTELITRAIFATFVYAIVTYTSESYCKRAFIGSISEDLLFKRWLKIFEAFPEGLAFIRDDKILFANTSLGEHLNLNSGSNSADDPLFRKLRNTLRKTKVRRIGEQEYEASIWSFLQKVDEKGGPFRMQ